MNQLSPLSANHDGLVRPPFRLHDASFFVLHNGLFSCQSMKLSYACSNQGNQRERRFQDGDLAMVVDKRHHGWIETETFKKQSSELSVSASSEPLTKENASHFSVTKLLIKPVNQESWPLRFILFPRLVDRKNGCSSPGGVPAREGFSRPGENIFSFSDQRDLP